ncbi:Tuftelin-interacting protein 11 [Hordeum vulgare]|nr:Tuftelin-interacting protein 11 [Hordeum vulgare]
MAGTAMATPDAKSAYPSHMPGSLALTTEAMAMMMRQWNYREGSGLGARGQGITAHIEPVERCPLNASAATKPSPLLCLVQVQGDGSAETAGALAAVVESAKVFDGKLVPGTWEATLPPAAVRYVVEEVITPRMAADAREWEPLWDSNCRHWLRPWVPLVGHLPDCLYGTVESKLVAHADHHDIVSAWKKYLHPTRWDAFARRHILPRLARQLRITPPKQMDCSFSRVMLWALLVRTHDVVTILEVEFFDRWEEALLHWLRSARPSMEEAVAWCAGWRNVFTPELLDDERVLARMEAGAAMVDREAQGLNSLVGYRVYS